MQGSHFRGRRALSLAAGFAWVMAGSAWGQSADGASPAPSTLPSPDAIRACLKEVRTAECLDPLFREALKTHSTLEALQHVQRLEATDAEIRRDCHPVVHAIGRETFRLKGSIHESFAACDQTCHSGCYHGSVERFLRGESLYAGADQHPSQWELRQKAAAACDPTVPLRLRYQCLHGLGHAIMFFAAYNLDNALDVCDALPDEWSQNSCYGGVFMENVVGSANGKRAPGGTDYHAPCNRVAGKYRRECYGMQTSRMAELGLAPERILDECTKAGELGALCAQSLGRDLSNDSRLGEHGAVARKCELASGDFRRACVRGVAYALADNTWDGRFALPFCAALASPADQDDCFRDTRQYLRTFFDVSAEGFAAECARYAPASERCAASAAQRSSEYGAPSASWGSRRAS
jgi:hypothetical protein